jgi:hypothetical protein
VNLLKRQPRPAEAAPVPTLVDPEDKRDQARITRLNRELERLQESEDCGYVTANELKAQRHYINREITELQQAIDRRRYEREQEAARQERRRTQMPQDVERLETDVAAILRELSALRERARALTPQAEHIRRSYGRPIGGHILGIPEIVGLADGFRSIWDVLAGPDSLIPGWLEHARNLGLDVPAPDKNPNPDRRPGDIYR